MYEKYCSDKEIAMRLCPYKIGDTFTSQKEIRDNDGILLAGTNVTITDIACNQFFGIPKILKNDLDNYVAEGCLFVYTLKADERTFSPCGEDDFVPKNKQYKSPARLALYKRMRLLEIIIGAALMIIGITVAIHALMKTYNYTVLDGYIIIASVPIIGLGTCMLMDNGLDKKFQFYRKDKYEKAIKRSSKSYDAVYMPRKEKQ